MILAALSSQWVTTEEWSEETQDSLSDSYNVVQTDKESDNSALLGASVLNGLVIIGIVCAITFTIVALLKYRFMKVLYGYLILTFMSLLFFVASEFFRVAVEAYGLDGVDKITYWFSLYNFAMVGTLSIFVPQGVPVWLTQAYLILASVLVAWQLSQFDPWTAWILLILLSLYDLFAVLTPCGPLKVLVDLMQQEDAPSLPPGLLFEATNRNPTNANTSRPTQQSRRSAFSNNTSTREKRKPSDTKTTTTQSVVQSDGKSDSTDDGGHYHYDDDGDETAKKVATTSRFPREVSRLEEEKVEMDNPQLDSSGNEQMIEVTLNGSGLRPSAEESSETEQEKPLDAPPEAALATGSSAHRSELDRGNGMILPLSSRDDNGHDGQPYSHTGRVVRIPLALARLYKLPLLNDPNPSWRRPEGMRDLEETSVATPEFSVEQLVSVVRALVPQNGGLIEPHPQQRPGGEVRYKITNARGELRRILFVGKETGSVYQDPNHEERCNSVERGDLPKENDRIRLGLGDFVFYSVLVALASDYGFSTFVASFLVILCGLLLTLLILAVMKRALPALPISILSGIVAYILTRLLVQDWIEEIHIDGTYF